MMKSLLNYLLNAILNCLVAFLSLFFWRNKNIWLFGSWMGDSFSDNSRFLFQYMHQEKEHFGVKQVVWVTRNKEVFLKLSKMGYKVFMMHSLKSYYYHLKAGVHIICNNSSSTNTKHDILTSLSFGAIKIQLWHGVGIKACNILTRKKKAFKYKIIDNFLEPLFSPGLWARCYFLATSAENKRVAVGDLGIKPKRAFVSMYPRLIKHHVCFEEEIDCLSVIKAHKQHGKAILYLPTFKKTLKGFVPPDEIPGFSSFLENNDYLWIQKKHSFDNELSMKKLSVNTIELPAKTDISTIIDCADLVITDYSSVSSDAIFKGIPTLEYCPDYDSYREYDRGFVNEFALYHVERVVKDPQELFKEIPLRINNFDHTKNKLVRDYLFERQYPSMDYIVNDIMTVIRKKGSVN